MKSWRGFDLERRKKKVINAFDKGQINSADMFPIIVNTPNYFGFGNNDMPDGYWEDPSIMVRFQEKAYESHFSKIDDDTIPYFMPWFGTGVLASAFGSEVKPAIGKGDDPYIEGEIIQKVEDITNLKIPKPEKSGLMPKVLSFIDYAQKNSDLPIGLTDINSPLCTAAQLCGYENLFIWMYEEPNAIHDLIAIISDALIDWVKVQKEHAGEPIDASSGLQGVWSPKGVGIWLSDDDLVSVGSEQYSEFIVPYYSKIFNEFGGGTLHFCGRGLHQADNILRIEGIRAVNNSPMGDFDIFGQMVKKLGHGKLTILIQDIAPEKIEEYYSILFDHIDDLRGIMLATFVLDNLASDNEGRAVPVQRDPVQAGNEIVRVVRKCVETKLKQQRSRE